MSADLSAVTIAVAEALEQHELREVVTAVVAGAVDVAKPGHPMLDEDVRRVGRNLTASLLYGMNGP